MIDWRSSQVNRLLIAGIQRECEHEGQSVHVRLREVKRKYKVQSEN